MEKKSILHTSVMKSVSKLVIILSLVSLVVPRAYCGAGQLKISPALPTEAQSPATFETWVQGNGKATDPHLFLVMTELCYNGLTGNVKIEWTGGSITIPNSGWTGESDNSKKVPPGTTNGACYTVASLKSELGTLGKIYWAFAPFLGGQNITQTHVSFTVTLPSTSPRMLVCVMGKSPGSTLFDMRDPPSAPGFVVFEPAPIFATLALLSAFAVFDIKRRKTV
jgi:hypothetical protein